MNINTVVLKRPERERYDWNKSVYRECAYCGEHMRTVLEDDDTPTCAKCVDQNYWAEWESLAEQALAKLEVAEARIVELESSPYRKRATEAEQQNVALRKSLETKPTYEWFVTLVRKHLRQADTVPVQHLGVQIRQLKDSRDGWKPRAEKAEADLAELRATAVPVGYAFETDVKLMLKGKMIHKMLTVREYQVDGAIPLFTHPAPPAKTNELVPEGMKYSSALPEFIGDSNEISSYRCYVHGYTRKVATQEQAYADAKSICALLNQ